VFRLHCNFGVRSSRAASRRLQRAEPGPSSGGCTGELFVGPNGRRLRSAWHVVASMHPIHQNVSGACDSARWPTRATLLASLARQAGGPAGGCDVDSVRSGRQATSELVETHRRENPEVDAGCTTVLIHDFRFVHIGTRTPLIYCLWWVGCDGMRI